MKIGEIKNNAGEAIKYKLIMYMNVGDRLNCFNHFDSKK
jgi:hypothetical protein